VGRRTDYARGVSSDCGPSPEVSPPPPAPDLMPLFPGPDLGPEIETPAMGRRISSWEIKAMSGRSYGTFEFICGNTVFLGEVSVPANPRLASRTLYVTVCKAVNIEFKWWVLWGNIIPSVRVAHPESELCEGGAVGETNLPKVKCLSHTQQTLCSARRVNTFSKNPPSNDEYA